MADLKLVWCACDPAARKHPYADAIYSVVSWQDDAYAVRIDAVNAVPITVSDFATEREANDWIAGHRHMVARNQPVAKPLPMLIKLLPPPEETKHGASAIGASRRRVRGVPIACHPGAAQVAHE